MQLPDSARRAIRSLAQIGTINAVVGLLLIFEVIDWTPGQIAAVNAVALRCSPSFRIGSKITLRSPRSSKARHLPASTLSRTMRRVAR